MSIRTITILDRIGTLIPGYTGYQTRDDQRRSDKKLRELISKILENIDGFLIALSKKCIHGQTDLNLLEIEELRKTYSTFSAKILFARYGTSGIFDKQQIKEKELAKIYSFDEQLVDHVNHIQLLMDQEQEPFFLIAALRSKLKEIEKLYNERLDFILFNGNK